MRQETHNGYTNYETWNYCLHVDNNQEQLEWVLDVARHLLANNETPYLALGEALKIDLEDNMPEIEISVYDDLLQGAIANIDWGQVARHYIEQVQEI